MKRWVWLLITFAMPFSSPMACGGDGCLRNSDCPSDETCRAGQCELKEPPVANSGGEGGEDSTPITAGTTGTGGNAGTGGTADSGGTSNAGSAGSATAGSAGNGNASAGEGGGAGEGGAGEGGAAVGGGGEAGALGGAGVPL